MDSQIEHFNYVIFIGINGKIRTTKGPRITKTLKLEHHGHNNVRTKVKIAFDVIFIFIFIFMKWYSSMLRD